MDTFVNLFKGYKFFIQKDFNGSKSFRIQNYVNGKPFAYREFYERFFKSQTTIKNQMFLEFIDLHE